MMIESFTGAVCEKTIALPATHPDHGPRRPQQDREIEQERRVLHIEEIVFELLARLLRRCGVVVVDLPPTGDPRPEPVTLVVQRDGREELVHELTAFRTRADEAH